MAARWQKAVAARALLQKAGIRELPVQFLSRTANIPSSICHACALQRHAGRCPVLSQSSCGRERYAQACLDL